MSSTSGDEPLNVDREALLAFIERLEVFETRAEELAASVNKQIDTLHDGNWAGAAAAAHRAQHDEWVANEVQMRDALGKLRALSSNAHSNYESAAQTNAAMWKNH